MFAARRSRAVLAAVALALAALLACPDGTVPATAPGAKNGEPSSALYYGLAACRNCHDRDKPYVDPDFPALCDLTEMKIWEKFDKHGIAHEVLKGDRAKRMAALLPGVKDVLTAKQCLSCHSVWLEGSAKADRTLKAEQGVSCVACHGPDRGWVDMHGAATERRRKEWRDMPRRTKEQKYGMTDLWDPATRARLCASCHIGNVAEGKVVTHAMYAAGHPPLPSFEVATFSDAMPRHWTYLKDKKPEVHSLFKFDPVRAALEETELVHVGGLVCFEESVRLLAEQVKGKDWPEFAQFDCYACHHDLKSDSWRQRRGYLGRPGRPPFREWPAVLARLEFAAHSSGKPDEANPGLEAGLGKLRAAFDAQPFGEPGKVTEAARELTAWAQRRTRALLEMKPNPDLSRRLLDSLVAVQGRRVPDYDSARQIAWSYMVLQRGENAAVAKALRDSPEWQTLAKRLNLSFPPGRTPLAEELSLSLTRINEYDPSVFAVEFAAVVRKSHELAKRQASK
jgi:hypothetical protein